MFTIVALPPGGAPYELTPDQTSLRYSTLAVGGFGACSFTIPGLQALRRVPYLARIRVMYGASVVWEGRVADRAMAVAAGDLGSSFQCFGFKQHLDETSVRRIWSKRDITWIDPGNAVGTTDGVNAVVHNSAVTLGLGQVNPADLSQFGLSLATAGVAFRNGRQAMAVLPEDTTITRLLATVDVVSGGNNWLVATWSSPDNSTWTTEAFLGLTGAGSGNAYDSGALVTDAAYIRVGGWDNDAVSPDAANFRIHNIRLLGTTLTEDATGGFYGGTILRDLIALIPDLHAGIIDTGDDFTIEAIERATRAAAITVVQEVAGYYDREWAVWEDGRFDWKTVNRDEPHWIAGLHDLISLQIEGSTENLARTAHVLYTDAATGRDAEASGDSTDQRNPHVRAAATKDDLTSGGTMTANTAAQLAARLAADRGAYPPVTGRVVLPAHALIPNAVAGPAPALLIRAGQNILLPDLPKDDVLQQGRDGQTLFHVSATDCDLNAGTVTLELEGQTRTVDVILARLAAVTRTLTG